MSKSRTISAPDLRQCGREQHAVRDKAVPGGDNRGEAVGEPERVQHHNVVEADAPVVKVQHRALQRERAEQRGGKSKAEITMACKSSVASRITVSDSRTISSLTSRRELEASISLRTGG